MRAAIFPLSNKAGLNSGIVAGAATDVAGTQPKLGDAMEELAITWPRVMSVWWLIFWRGALGSFLIAAAIGFIIGFSFGLLRTPMNPLIAPITRAIIGWLWFIAVIRIALRKKYRAFRIVLLPVA